MDNQSFWPGVENSLVKLILALPRGSGLAVVAGDSFALYANRGYTDSMRVVRDEKDHGIGE